MASKWDDDESDYSEGKGGGGGGGGGKYDDEGGGAGAGGGGKGDDDPGAGAAILPPIVQAFAHHVMSKKFRTAVEKFLADNCRPFAGATASEEQNLEWTAVYQVRKLQHYSPVLHHTRSRAGVAT